MFSLYLDRTKAIDDERSLGVRSRFKVNRQTFEVKQYFGGELVVAEEMITVLQDLRWLERAMYCYIQGSRKHELLRLPPSCEVTR